MIDDPDGPVDYAELGSGQTIVFVPGSCSTGAAWRPVIARLNGSYRVVTTSLSGYGGTAERRHAGDRSIGPVVAALGSVVKRAGGRVHLVGHSFGGLVGLGLALRDRAQLASLTIFEAPAPGMLAVHGQDDHLAAFTTMTDQYIQAHNRGDRNAIATMIDFYGGAGTFASWPPSVRAYAETTTFTNVLDWTSAYAFKPDLAALAALTLPITVVVGAASHPSVVAANRLISEDIPGSAFVTVDEASHFMIATHADAVARVVTAMVQSAEACDADPCRSAR